MFDSIETLRETAVRMGLVGAPLDEVLERFTDAHAARRRAINKRFETRTAPIEDRLRSVEKRRRYVEQGPPEIERLRQEVVDLEVRRAELSAELDLLTERAVGRQQREAEKHWRNVYGAVRARVEASPTQVLEDELAVARAISDHRRELWTLDSEELRRRREILEAELRDVDQEITVASERVECLKKRHMTKTASGFLVWAGYTVLAAVGAVIGYLLQVDEGARPDPLSALFQALAAALTKLSEDFLGALRLFLAMALGGLLLIGLLVFATDFFLARFDPGWPRSARRPPRRGGKGKNSNSGAFLRLPRTEVRRSSYVQLLASFPFVFVGALTLFLIGWSGAAGDPSASVTHGVVSSYFGAAVALLVTALSVLYVVQVVWPRWLAVESASSGKRTTILRSNPELAVLMALVPLSFLLTATLSEEWQPERLGWAFIALFMASSSLALAHGIVARGVFKDHEVLENRRKGLLRDIELLSTRPLLGEGIFDDLDSIREQIAQRRQEADELDVVSLLYFEPDGGTEQSASLGELWFWLHRGRMDKKAEERIRALFAQRRRAGTARTFRDEDLPEVLTLRRELAGLDVRLSELRALRHRWEAACGPDAERQADAEWQALRTQLFTFEAEMHEEVERLEKEYGRQLAELRAAHRLGELTRPDFPSGPGGPQGPPPPLRDDIQGMPS